MLKNEKNLRRRGSLQRKYALENMVYSVDHDSKPECQTGRASLSCMNIEFPYVKQSRHRLLIY
jgi:hypothetical protein